MAAKRKSIEEKRARDRNEEAERVRRHSRIGAGGRLPYVPPKLMAYVPHDPLSPGAPLHSAPHEDAAEHLKMAQDAIELQPYLKSVRKLANKQFIAKALAMKIAKRQRPTASLSGAPPAYHK